MPYVGQQISDNGLAMLDGQDVFISVPLFTNERLSYGKGFTSGTVLTSAMKSTTTADFATEAVSGSALPAFKNSNWFSFGTSGAVYPPAGVGRKPESVDNKVIIHATVVGASSSHSGIFQELRRLNVGSEYRLTIDLTYSVSVGTLSVSRLYNVGGYDPTTGVAAKAVVQSDVTAFELPNEDGQITLDFKAETPSDIIFIDYTSTVDGNTVEISGMSVKQKDDYKVPVTVDLPLIGLSKVLVPRSNETMPYEEGEPITP